MKRWALVGIAVLALGAAEPSGRPGHLLGNVQKIEDSGSRMMLVANVRDGSKIEDLESASKEICRKFDVKSGKFCNIIYLKFNYTFDLKNYISAQSKSKFLKKLRESGNVLGYFRKYNENTEMRMICKYYALAKQTDNRMCWESGKAAPWYLKMGQSQP